MKSLVLTLLSSLLLCSCSYKAFTGSKGSVYGVFVDENGLPIMDAKISLMRNHYFTYSLPSSVEKTKTDKNGEF